MRAAVVLLAALIVLPGCGSGSSGGDPSTGEPSRDPGAPLASRDRSTEQHPFAPASLRIYPLTRLDRSGGGAGGGGAGAAIVFHFELKDRWGDGVKALGQLQVFLYRPSGGFLSGAEVQDRDWLVTDFEKPDENSGFFDPATRTYRVLLTGLPDWAQATAPETGADGERGAGAYLKLRAIFTTGGADSADERRLQDEFVIQP